MANENINKGKHLKLYNRIQIQNSLDEGMTLNAISNQLGKDPTTISKEIKRNRMFKAAKSVSILGKCQHHKTCKIKNLCNGECDTLCKKCKLSNCYRKCNAFSTKSCTKLNRYPHVCNGCSDKIGCKLDKYYYRSNVAQTNYESMLSDSREGISLTQEELDNLDNLVSPLVKLGQSISHIHSSNSDKIPLSIKSLYNYVDAGCFEARNIDLRRKVKYKPRKKQVKVSTSNKDQKCRVGRTYDDFNTTIKDYNPMNVVEMDTVEGKKGKGEPHILTLFFRNSSLMIGILIEHCTMECVNSAIDQIYTAIGEEAFRQAFPIILTDNGSEFKNPEAIEFDEFGNQRTRVFYCNPLASWQKGKIEKNHEYLRYIIPKGKSFKGLTQDKVTLMINHINSAYRHGLNGNTPIQLAELLLHKNVISELNLIEIPANEVHLKPALIKG